MFCPNCGAQNKDGSKYCTVCGAELPVQDNQDISTPGGEEKPASNEKRKKGFFRSPGGIITIVVIIAAAVVVVFLVLRMQGRGSEVETTPVVKEAQTATDEAEIVSEDPEPSQDVAATDVSDEYILPESNTRYYTESELSGLTKDQLRLARNEIYARHGRLFDSADLQEYFDGQAWYNGTIAASAFNDNVLNEYERANVKTIQSVEDALGNTTSSTQTRQANNGDNAWFSTSWGIIQDYGLYSYDWLNRNANSTAYTYSNLAFDLKASTMEDMGDYYSIQAVFQKPLTITKDIIDHESYTVCIDELSGETKVLTCYEDEAGLYLIDDNIEVYTVHPDDLNPNLYELWYDTDDKRYVPFYEGVLRIRKDAVTGASITNGPYETVTMHTFDQGYDGIDGLAFDSDGYVTQLLWLGD